MSIKRDILERPFDPSLIRTRKGGHGQTLSYVEAAEIVKRLNEGLDSEWSFEVVQHEVHDSEVVVLGKLSTNNIVKMAFGGSSITVTRDGGAVVSLADDLKSAATDSMKKCATLLGVGLSLYADGQPHVATPTRATPPTNGRNGNGGTVPGNGGAKPSNGNGSTRSTTAAPDRLTQKQLSCVWALARRIGLTTEDVRERSRSTFGVLPEFLTRADASVLINDLQGESEPADFPQVGP